MILSLNPGDPSNMTTTAKVKAKQKSKVKKKTHTPVREIAVKPCHATGQPVHDINPGEPASNMATTAKVKAKTKSKVKRKLTHLSEKSPLTILSDRATSSPRYKFRCTFKHDKIAKVKAK